jgi:glycosyltransferase involved in cell wall biosynthesis
MSISLTDLTFVLIAKNEQFSIGYALKSLSNNAFNECQIVLVDSASEDQTLDKMKQFSLTKDNVKVISCSGSLNAAKTRNIGLRKAENQYIFFIDGDTEISYKFVISALKEFEKDINCLAITGQLSENIYNDNYTKILHRKKDRFHIDSRKKVVKTGGNVIIKKSALEQYGAWNEDFIINEDFELTLRLSQYGKILAIPLVMGIHHSRVYDDRNIGHIFKGYSRFAGLLLRAHCFNAKALKSIIKTEIGIFVGLTLYSILFLSYIASIFFEIQGVFTVGIWIASALFFIDMVSCVIKNKNMIERIMNRVVSPIMAIFGFFGFIHVGVTRSSCRCKIINKYQVKSEP